MKHMLAMLMLLTCGSAAVSAQHAVQPTDSVLVAGKVKKTAVFSLADLAALSKSVIKDQVIYNHQGEAKDTLSGMRGVSLRQLLAPVEYVYENPKTLNEFYFVLTASDGYKVVLSWNEVYNTASGNEFFIVTEIKGKKLKALEQRIVFLSTADLKTGRRYIKGLSRIDVKQAD